MASRRLVSRRTALTTLGIGWVALATQRLTAYAQDATPATDIRRSDHPLTNSWVWDRDLNDNPAAQACILHVDGTYIEYDPGLGLGLGAWAPIDEAAADLIVIFEELASPWGSTRGPVAMLEPEFEPEPFAFKRGYVAIRQSLRLDESGTTVMATGLLQAIAANGTELYVGPFTRSGTVLAVCG